MKLKTVFLILIILIFVLSFDNSFAESEPILITKSPSMENVIFDGKWTNFSEWKQSSHNMLTYDNGKTVIHLRTAHFGDYIYVFVDPVTDLTLDEKLDETIICFDGKNNKNKIHDTDDFCFSSLFETKQGNVFQGSSIDDSNIILKKINNPENFIAISTVSDENDRYIKAPHPSYEFKIPIKLLERSDNYGFYLSVYDASSNEYFSWPENSTRENSSIPSPSKWGDIISPDKSLPEMNLPILVLGILILTTIFIQSKAKTTIVKTF